MKATLTGFVAGVALVAAAVVGLAVSPADATTLPTTTPAHHTVRAASSSCWSAVTIYDATRGKWVGPNANYTPPVLQASLSYVVGSAYFYVCQLSNGEWTFQSEWNSEYVGEDTQWYNNLTPTLPNGGYASGQFWLGCYQGYATLNDGATNDPIDSNSGLFLQGGTQLDAFNLYSGGSEIDGCG